MKAPTFFRPLLEVNRSMNRLMDRVSDLSVQMDRVGIDPDVAASLRLVNAHLKQAHVELEQTRDAERKWRTR